MDIKNVNGRWRALALAFGLLGVAGAAAAGDAPPPVVVTAEDLRQWTLPAMTKLDATAALAATPQFRLLDMEGKEITDEAATLIWEGGVLTYKPRLGLTLLFR